MQTPETSRLAEGLFRQEAGRLVATLTAHLGTHHLQLAEDVVQEALVRALQTWPYRGVPDNPAAWLTQTAKNLALDQLRREQRWNTKQDSIATEHERWLSTPVIETQDTFAAELGHQAIALTHFRQAENLASLPAERDFISRRLIEIGDKGMRDQ